MLPYTLVRSTDPTIEPLTAAELATHLRLDITNREPVPTTLTAALASPAAAGSVNAGAHRYRVTFVTPDGETDGGDISAAVTVVNPAVNGQVALTDIPLGGGAVTARRVYRTAANGSVFLFLQQISDNTTTTLLDTTADLLLGASCPTTNSTNDPELYRLISAARNAVENFTRRALIRQRWDQRMPRFPMYDGDPVLLMRPNLLSVDLVTYVAESGETEVLDPSEFVVDPHDLPGKLWTVRNGEWPDVDTDTRGNTVLIRFWAGYGTTRSSVPDGIRQAILIHAADLYAHRESFVTGTISQPIQFTAKNLLAQYVWAEAR